MVLMEAESGVRQPPSGEARTRFKIWYVLFGFLRGGLGFGGQIWLPNPDPPGLDLGGQIWLPNPEILSLHPGD